MSGLLVVDLGQSGLLEFSGPDTVRFLNGQLTQDVRLLAGGIRSLPSCVTDAKGKLQFRVMITESTDGSLWVACPAERSGELEARLTRYLIADDVETRDLTGSFRLLHLIGPAPVIPEGVIARVSNRIGIDGTDWWVPVDSDAGPPGESRILEGDELEDFRITRGVPVWGHELTEGLLPPEAGLDATDVSYQKGCYIGQEVISRIKSAGKVNRRLVRLELDSGLDPAVRMLLDADGAPAGEITSVSPRETDGVRHALGFVKRGVDRVFLEMAAGDLRPVRIV